MALSCGISFAFLCGMVASTLGVGVSTGLITLGVGLSTGLATLGVVASSLGTCLGGGVCACGAWLSSSSNFCSASNSIMPFVFLLPFRACARLLMAFVTMFADVRVGCVMYLCLKNTVSDTLSHWFSSHGSCGSDSVQVRFGCTIRQLYSLPMFLVSHYSRVIVLHIPLVLMASCYNQSFCRHIGMPILLGRSLIDGGD